MNIFGICFMKPGPVVVGESISIPVEENDGVAVVQLNTSLEQSKLKDGQ